MIIHDTFNTTRVICHFLENKIWKFVNRFQLLHISKISPTTWNTVYTPSRTIDVSPNAIYSSHPRSRSTLSRASGTRTISSPNTLEPTPTNTPRPAHHLGSASPWWRCPGQRWWSLAPLLAQHHASDRYAAAVAFYLSLSPPPPPSGHHQRIRVIAPVPRRLRPLVHGGSFRRGQLPEKITLGEFSRGRDTMRALLERKLVFFLTEGRKEEGVGYWMARWESFWQSFKRFIRRNESRGGMVERGGVYE